MKSAFRLTLLLVGLCLSTAAHPQSGDQKKKLTLVPIGEAPSFAKRALIIGVGNYELANPLRTTANDARAFARLLQDRFGFPQEAIVLLTDAPGTAESQHPTRNRVLNAIHTLLAGVTEQSEVVFFFSGHGARDGDEDWLVPMDGD